MESEIARLKNENDRLRNENASLKKENQILAKENQEIKSGMAKKVRPSGRIELHTRKPGLDGTR